MTEQQAQDARDARAERREVARVERIRDSKGAIRLSVLVIVLFGISIFWSSHTAQVAAAGRAQIEQKAITAEQKLIAAQQKAIASSCDFWYPLTGLPVTINVATGKPTELSVRIITGARESYAGQCTPPHAPLPPPDPTLVKWAEYFHLPVTY